MKAPYRYRHFIAGGLLFQFWFLAPAWGTAKANPAYLGYSNYQVITDHSFDVSRYFRQMKSYGVNLQRIWVLGYSGTLSSGHERMPFRRQKGKYDLQSMDPIYFARLQEVLAQASQYNQRVMLTLFDCWSLSNEQVFERSPWYHKNNTQNLLKKSLPDFYDLANPKIRAVQENLVRRIVHATAEYHPIYEIMNEPREVSGCLSLTRWHNQVAEWILNEDPEAEIALNPPSGCNEMIESPWLDMISFHGTQWIDEGICNLAGKYAALGKQILIDTDGAFRWREDNKRVQQWLREALECGASFNHKDDIYRLDRDVLLLFRKARTQLNSAGNEKRH